MKIKPIAFISFVFIILLLSSLFMPAYAAQSITLKQGFNFISFTESVSMTAVQFRALNPAIEDIYLFSSAAGSFLSAGEGSLTSLAAGKGYIVKSSSASSITISVSGGALSTIGNISLKTGFNLAGFSKMPEALTASALMTRGPKIKGIYKWSAAAGSFVSVVRNPSGVIEQLDGIDPSLNAGGSYFINLSEDQQLNYDGVTVLIDTSITPPPPPVSDMKFLLKFGSRGAGAGQFAQGPINVAVDAAGNILTSDTYNHRINKFSPAGVYISSFGSQGTDYGNFSYPTGIAAGKDGCVYVVDYGNARIQRFDADGNFLSSFGSRGSGNGQFQKPDCVAVDSSGNVYVSDFGNNNIQKFSYMGSFISKFGAAGAGDGLFGIDSPKDIAVSPSGKIYAADLGNNRVQVFNSTGAYESQWGAFGTGIGQFDRPHGIAVDSIGDIFVSDKNCRVQKFSAAGAFILSVGGKGMLDGQFEDPSGIFIDVADNLLVADFGNARVQIFGSGAPGPGGDELKKISLSRSSVELFISGVYDLSAITAMAEYASGAVKAAAVSWSVKSGGGIISGLNYSAPSIAGIVVLTASYSESGITKTADLYIAVNQVNGSEVYIPSTAAVSTESRIVAKEEENLIKSVEENLLVFDAAIASSKSFAPGQIVVSGSSVNAPAGFMRKIVSVTAPAGGEIIVNTAAANLEEVFTGGGFALAKDYSSTDISGFDPYIEGAALESNASYCFAAVSGDKGRVSPAESLDINVPVIKLKTSIPFSKDSPFKLSVEGSIAIKPSLEYNFDFNNGADIKIVTKLKAEPALVINMGAELAKESKAAIDTSVKLGKLKLGKLVAYVPTPLGVPLPIILNSDITLYIRIKGQISGGVITNIKAALEADSGFHYKGGVFMPAASKNFSGDIDGSFKAAFELESALGAEFGVYLYDVAGPAANLELYWQESGGLNAKLSQADEIYAWRSTAGGLKSAVAGKFEMFARAYDVSLDLFDLKVYEKLSPVLKSLYIDAGKAVLDQAADSFSLSDLKISGVYYNKLVKFGSDKSFDSTNEINVNLLTQNQLIKDKVSWKIISGGGRISGGVYMRDEYSPLNAVLEAEFTEMIKDAANSKTAELILSPAGTVAAPVFTPSAGVYTSAQSVTITCATPGAAVKYTLNGLTPCETYGVIYSAPINLAENKTVTIKAYAYKTGLRESQVVSADYTINITPVEKVALPVIMPASGTFSGAQSVSISCATSDALIKYTLDSSLPSADNGLVYSAPISVGATATLKVIAVKEGMINSDVVSADFIIESSTPGGAEIVIDLGGGVKLEMVKISAGSFQMGSSDTEIYRDKDLEGPVHTVNITKDFYMTKYEITQGQWFKIMGVNPAYNKGGDNYPVEQVKYSDIVYRTPNIAGVNNDSFLAKLNLLSPGGYYGFDLPTEAQWEYACRAGAQTAYHWGENQLDYKAPSLINDYSWYSQNSRNASNVQVTHPVGEKSPNAFGLYDMTGNVAEWCRDYPRVYTTAAVSDPQGFQPSSSVYPAFVARGGNYYSSYYNCRSAYRGTVRGHDEPDKAIGFRIMLQ